MSQTKYDPLLRDPVQWDSIQKAASERRAVNAACTRSPIGISLDAIAAKYPQVADLRKVCLDVAVLCDAEAEKWDGFGELGMSGMFRAWAGQLRAVVEDR